MVSVERLTQLWFCLRAEQNTGSRLLWRTVIAQLPFGTAVEWQRYVQDTVNRTGHTSIQDRKDRTGQDTVFWTALHVSSIFETPNLCERTASLTHTCPVLCICSGITIVIIFRCFVFWILETEFRQLKPSLDDTGTNCIIYTRVIYIFIDRSESFQ